EQKKEPKMTVRYYISSADLTAGSSPQQSETTGTWRISCTGVWTW
ncbi:H repeat-associated yhhI domain protein, partial [Escherichia coli 99.1793]